MKKETNYVFNTCTQNTNGLESMKIVSHNKIHTKNSVSTFLTKGVGGLIAAVVEHNIWTIVPSFLI